MAKCIILKGQIVKISELNEVIAENSDKFSAKLESVVKTYLNLNEPLSALMIITGKTFKLFATKLEAKKYLDGGKI